MGEPTEDLVRREIEKARRILQSDKHAAALGGLSERFDKHFPDNSGGKPGGDDPASPPPAIPPKEQPKKRSVWWPSDD